jgi:hypothetical protein
MLVHRLIAQEALGRSLQPIEIVHHMDGNPQNNAPENLMVLPNQGDHLRIHHTKYSSPEERRLAAAARSRKCYHNNVERSRELARLRHQRQYNQRKGEEI